MINKRNKITGRIEPILIKNRFWNKVIKTTGCWIWNGAQFSNGYGNIRHGNRRLLAHRVAFQLSLKIDPKDKKVCHRCDNRLCVNPKHLFIGTQADNIKDMILKGRARYADNRGESNPASKLTQSDVLDIRKLRKCGFKIKELSKTFNVSKPTIEKIVGRQLWKHI